MDSSDDGFEIVTGSSEKIAEYTESIYEEKEQNKAVAIVSAIFATLAFSYNNLQPSSGVVLLHAMERDSIPLQTALCNKKPTMIEFYADWCQSCKEMAPTMRAMELQYSDKVNFITVNGVDQRNYNLVRKFKVDGIPHVAILGPDHELKTSLVGAVPKGILKDEIEALVSGGELPYLGMEPSVDSRIPFENVPGLCSLAGNDKADMLLNSVDGGSGSRGDEKVVVQEIPTSAEPPSSAPSVYISDELRNMLKTRSVQDILDGKRF